MKNLLFAYILTIGLFFLVVGSAQAALVNQTKVGEFNANINAVAEDSGYNPETKLENIISTIIRIILSVLGVIFLALMFAAGNTWMQAAGNEERIKKSQKTIQGLLIGLCIILVAYALSAGFSGLLAKALLTK